MKLFLVATRLATATVILLIGSTAEMISSPCFGQERTPTGPKAPQTLAEFLQAAEQRVVAAQASLRLMYTRSPEILDNLNNGVTAFENAKYRDAIALFGRAVELAPTFTTARLYLASAYMNEYIPGVASLENREMARNSLENFQKVLESDPRNATAVESIGSLYYLESQGMDRIEDKFERLDKARDWYQKLTELEPSKKEAFYSLGVIAWAKWYPDWNSARSMAGMKLDASGPLKNRLARQELKTKCSVMIDEAIYNLREAIALDDEYDDAMAYLSLFYREGADLAASEAEYIQGIDTADALIKKALNIRKLKAERHTEVLRHGAN